jgi:hypothetical protein
MVRPEGFEPPTQGLELPGSLQAELRALDFFGVTIWGERRDLNPRPSGPQPDALTPELRPPSSSTKTVHEGVVAFIMPRPSPTERVGERAAVRQALPCVLS